jgi:phosphocarrier,  HPr family
MIKKNIVVGNSTNIETRPAMLVQLASKFKSSIYIEKGNKTVNAKSIMGMMTLGLVSKDEISLNIDGSDEEEAFLGLASYLE